MDEDGQSDGRGNVLDTKFGKHALSYPSLLSYPSALTCRNGNDS